jgi:hypothetical protein
MPTIPGFPAALSHLHHAWHQPSAHPGTPTRRHLPSAAGSGLEFLQFHRDYMKQFRAWFDVQAIAKQFDVTPWTAIPPELKQSFYGWGTGFANQERRIVTNSPAFSTHDEFGLYVELNIHNQFLHGATASRYNEPLVANLHSPESTLFYKIHGLVDHWWSQWRKFDCMAVSGSHLFAIERGALTRIDPVSGSRQVLGAGNEWAGSTCMAASGGFLYIVQGRNLVRADSTTGARTIIGQDDWTGSTCAAAYGPHIYIVQDRFLLRVTPSTGAWQFVGTGDWTGSTCMAAVGNRLYVIQGPYLVRADPTTGAWEVVGTGDWSGSTCMAAYGGNLYVVQGSALVRANPTNGAWQVLGAGNEWDGSSAMAASGDRLYITQRSYVVRTVPASGEWQVI